MFAGNSICRRCRVSTFNIASSLFVILRQDTFINSPRSSNSNSHSFNSRISRHTSSSSPRRSNSINNRYNRSNRPHFLDLQSRVPRRHRFNLGLGAQCSSSRCRLNPGRRSRAQCLERGTHPWESSLEDRRRREDLKAKREHGVPTRGFDLAETDAYVQWRNYAWDDQTDLYISYLCMNSIWGALMCCVLSFQMIWTHIGEVLQWLRSDDDAPYSLYHCMIT